MVERILHALDRPKYNGTAAPFSVIALNTAPAECVGSMPCSPSAPSALVTVNESVLAAASHWIEPNDEPLRPSSHASICRRRRPARRAPAPPRRSSAARRRGGVGVHVRREGAVVTVGPSALSSSALMFFG